MRIDVVHYQSGRFFCYLDRINVAMAALQMNGALRFDAATFGFGAGIFFLGYALFEVPSNVILARIGARRWIARIAITWGLLACAMAWVRTPTQFYILRFLLGVAEAGFFPGVIYYLSRWIPTAYRARAHAAFMIAIPSSQIVGGPLGGVLLGLEGVGHLSGWQWLFLIEGLPSVLLGVMALKYLTDCPDDAHWLPTDERRWLLHRLEREQQQNAVTGVSLLRTFGNPLVWVLTIPYFAFYTVNMGYALWAPTLVRDALKASNTTTGLVIGGIYALAILVYFLAGRLSDRRDERCAVAALGLALACAGCIGAALIAPSPLRVAAFSMIAMLSPLFLGSFWCLPTRFLKGPSAAAAIGLVSAIGSSGGFFGPSIIGSLKQTTGSDVGAFLGLAALAMLGTFVCLGLRVVPSLKPQSRPLGAVPTASTT
ncbi:MAG TPA: MFS transporter [Steroidobacteraceae bacterium]|nr:MFS transporter [Steroidobacteraceae bacterium]